MLTLQSSQAYSFLYFNHYLMFRAIPAASRGCNLKVRTYKEDRKIFPLNFTDLDIISFQ